MGCWNYDTEEYYLNLIDTHLSRMPLLGRNGLCHLTFGDPWLPGYSLPSSKQLASKRYAWKMELKAFTYLSSKGLVAPNYDAEYIPMMDISDKRWGELTREAPFVKPYRESDFSTRHLRVFEKIWGNLHLSERERAQHRELLRQGQALFCFVREVTPAQPSDQNDISDISDDDVSNFTCGVPVTPILGGQACSPSRVSVIPAQVGSGLDEIKNSAAVLPEKQGSERESPIIGLDGERGSSAARLAQDDDIPLPRTQSARLDSEGTDLDASTESARIEDSSESIIEESDEVLYRKRSFLEEEMPTAPDSVGGVAMSSFGAAPEDMDIISQSVALLQRDFEHLQDDYFVAAVDLVEAHPRVFLALQGDRRRAWVEKKVDYEAAPSKRPRLS